MNFRFFNLGVQYIFYPAQGWPTPTNFLLSTKNVDEHDPNAVLSGVPLGALSATPATGYGDIAQASPSGGSGLPLTSPMVMQFATVTWDTGVNTNWPDCKSVVAYGGSAPLCAWNLLDGGAAKPMGAAHTITPFTPSIVLTFQDP